MKKIACLIVLALTLGCYGAAAAQQPTTSAAASTNAAYVQGVAPGYRPSAGSGLNLKLAAGTAFCGNTVRNYAGGTLTLAASATNYVYLNTASNCVPAANKTGFTAASIPIATVVTSASAVTTVTDVRTWFAAPSGAGTAGSTSTSNTWTAPQTYAAAPSNVLFKGPSPWIDVRAQGPMADGSTDDTTAIQTAINALPADGGTVFFPCGRYKITSGLTLGTKEGWSLIGQGHIGWIAVEATWPSVFALKPQPPS
jgi:polygalacturonase